MFAESTRIIESSCKNLLDEQNRNETQCQVMTTATLQTIRSNHGLDMTCVVAIEQHRSAIIQSALVDGFMNPSTQTSS